MNFSICLIAKNEEKTLPRLLDSLAEFTSRGGEILLLDTGSTDKTVEVAKSFGVEVHEVGDKFRYVIDGGMAEEINKMFVVEGEEKIVYSGDTLFHYSDARNYIASFAPTDMIATPDCDEVYTKFDIDKIEQEINEGVEQLEYNFVFSHDEYGREAMKFMHCKFYNRHKLHWENAIHEVLVGKANKKFLDESIIKLEHFQNEETNRGHYLKGLAYDCYKNPSNERNSHYFGRELLWTGHYKSAIKELEHCIAIHWWKAEIAQSMIYIARAYGFLNEPEKQVEWLNKAFYTNSTRRESLIDLGQFYKHNQNPQAALCYAVAAMEIPWDGFYGNNMAHYTVEPNEIAYWASGWLGRIEDAQKYLQKCLEYEPLNSKFLTDYRYYYGLPKVSIVIPNLERPEGLKRCLDSIATLNYPENLIEVIVEDGEGTVPIKVARGLEKATGEWILYGANDIEFTPDSLILGILDSIAEKKRLIAFDTGVRNSEGYINEHFMIHKDLVPLIGGEIFDTEFHHVGVDDLLWKKCDKLGEAMISRGQIKHHHFSRIGSGIEKDAVIEKGWKNEVEDRALLQRKLKEI